MNPFLALSFFLALFFVNHASARISISTLANANISADSSGTSFTTLTGPAIDEGASLDISTGTIVLNAPAGFAFDPTATVQATVSKIAGSGTPLALSSTTAAVTASAITITVSATDSGGKTRSRITWSGIRVQATVGTPLASGNITDSGTSILKGLTTTSSFGHLTEVGGAASRLVFSVQPGGATVGSAFAMQPVVVTQDQFGNNSSSGLAATNNITLSLSSGTGPLQGNPTLNIGTSGGNGTASYSGLRIDVVGPKQLTASSDAGLPSITSSVFNVGPGPASKLVIATEPSASAVAGVPFVQQPVVLIEDAFNNVRSNDTLVVTAARQAGTGTLQGTTSIAAVGGVASFANLAHPVATTITISFTSGTLTAAVSTPIAVAAGPFTQLQVLLPGESAAPGTASGKSGSPAPQTVGVSFPVTVSAVDANWNPIATNDTIHLSSSDGTATLPPNTALSGGRATLNVTMNTSGTQTLTAADVTHSSIASGTSSPFSVSTQGTANGPVLPAQPNQAVNELTTLVVTNTATDSHVSTNGSGQMVTNTFIFNYSSRTALLAGGWNFIATNPDGTPRNTEITNTADGAVISYDQTVHPGVLRIPCDEGDLWGSLNDSRNSLFRSLPANWTSMQLALSFAPTINYQQVHLALYQDDDNFTQSGMAHNDGLGGEVTTLIWEVHGSPNHNFFTLNSVTSIHLRLDRNLNNGNLTGYYSLNGSTWNSLGTVNTPLVNPRLCIWVGGSPVPWNSSLPSCDLQRLDIISTNTSGPALTYQLVNAPAGASIDGNGIITWTPTEAQGPSTNVITTVVTDNQQPPVSATNSFTVVVNEVNTPPVLPAQPNQTIIGQTTLVVTNTATDSDIPANQLTYQLLTAPASAVIDSNGVITWTPTAAQVPSTNTFVTVVTDYNPWAINNQHLSVTNSFTVTVLPSPPPNGPVLPPQITQTINALATLVVTNTATDPRLTTSPRTTNTITFSYTNRSALLADGWSYVATAPGGAPRNTEITNTSNGAVVSYDQSAHPGTLRIPCDLGDLWASANNTRNSLFRALPTNWLSLQLGVAFSPSMNYQQTHLTLYQDDNNYVQSGVAYNGGQKAAMDQEVGGSPSTPGVVSVSVTNVHLRLDRTIGSPNVSALYSLNGSTWTTLAQVSQSLVNPRLCIWVGGSSVPWTNGLPNCDLQRLDIVLTNQAVPVTLAYQLINPPAGATIDSNGIITWTPTQAQAPSTNTITTVVTDNGSPPLSATNSFTVIVNVSGMAEIISAPNPAPVGISYNLADQTVGLNFSGEPGRSYQIEWSSAVTGPWAVLKTVAADGLGQITCKLAAPAPPAYFRVSTGP